MGESQERPKKWILNAFSMSTPGHVAAGMAAIFAGPPFDNEQRANISREGSWAHPENRIEELTKIEYWTDLAKILEGHFHGLFLADMLGIYDVYKGPGNLDTALPGGAQFPQCDPSSVLGHTSSQSFADSDADYP